MPSGPIVFSTDLATLVAFDAEALKHRVRAKGDWWRVDPITGLDEVADGRMAIFPLGQEGTFRLLFRAGDLTEDERRRVVGKVEGLGLAVLSGDVFVGAAERLPGDGRGERMSEIPGTGALYPLEPGRYAVTAHVLDWRDDDACFDEDNEPLPTAPADVVLTVAPIAPGAAAPDVPFELPGLLDLIPTKEAKGKARVPGHVKRPRPKDEPVSGRRRSSAPSDLPAGPEVVARVAPPPARGAYSFPGVVAAFREVVGDALHPPATCDVAAIVLRPRDRTLQTKELTIGEVLEKVTRVREQMRVLEAKVNADDSGLSFEERVALEVPITRVYESLDDFLRMLATA